MKTVRTIQAWFACAALLAAVASTALADGCPADEERADIAKLNKAEALEQAGKLQEAFSTASNLECADYRRAEALKLRVGKALGGQAESRGQLKAAFEWYQRVRLNDDADRVMLRQAKEKPEDAGVFGEAFRYFQTREAESTLRELRALAAKNADKALAEEERAYTARMESFGELDKAGGWLSYLGDAQLKRKADRAEKRGDALFEKDGLGMLEKALRYYQIAGNPQKERRVQDKAMRLADGYVKTGETATAARFYSLAGAHAKAEEVERRAAESGQKKEAKRQEQFKQEQDDLEKELGF